MVEEMAKKEGIDLESLLPQLPPILKNPICKIVKQVNNKGLSGCVPDNIEDLCGFGDGKGISAGAIAGIVIEPITVVVLLVLIFLYFRKHK